VFLHQHRRLLVLLHSVYGHVDGARSMRRANAYTYQKDGCRWV
jgi:hypothetical protein